MLIVEYIPIAILFIIATAIAVLVIVLGTVFGPRRKSFRKQSPYESGMMPIGPGTRRMNVRYYLVAVLFILFDVEIIFFYPWAVKPCSMITIARSESRIRSPRQKSSLA